VNGFRAVLWRELRVVFATPLAWVALGAFSVVTALLFWLELLQFEVDQQRALAVNDPQLLSLLDFNDLLLGSVFNHAQVLLIFVVPLLTMRLFADEARQGTLDLLLAAPLRTRDLVLAKLAGVVVVLVAAGALLLVYPALLSLFGRAVVTGDGVVDWAQVLSGVLGVILCGSLYAALGAAISASTSSPSAASLVTALVLVGLWFAGSAAAGLEGIAGPVLDWVAPSTHVERFTRGIIAVPDLVYFVGSFAALAYVTGRIVDARRRS
jgi:ABC-2 type transport system permease protein